MIIRLVFGRGHIDCTKIKSIDCPNGFNGIGDAIVYGSFWTGEVHLINQEFKFHWSSVIEIKTRSNDYETDEPWKVIWKAPKTFEYKPWFDAAALFKRGS